MVLVPFFLFSSVIVPQTQVVLSIFWVISLACDLHSTHKFYQKEPQKFARNERNKIFVAINRKFSFQKASIIFPLSVEIPLLLFFAFLPLQTLYGYMFNTSAFNFFACLATSFGVAGIGHMQAATSNLRHASNKNNKLLVLL
jgi:hypothetical protein